MHILGGSPPKQYGAVQQLTQPTLTGLPPADIVGLDWNGAHLGAQYGEFWTSDGWDDSGRDAEHVTVRKTIRHSLGRLREFWQTHGIWPEMTPQDTGLTLEYQGPTPEDLVSTVCTTCGTDVWKAERGPYVAEYGTGECCGYCSYECFFTQRQRNRFEELVDERSVYISPS